MMAPAVSALLGSEHDQLTPSVLLKAPIDARRMCGSGFGLVMAAP